MLVRASVGSCELCRGYAQVGIGGMSKPRWVLEEKTKLAAAAAAACRRGWRKRSGTCTLPQFVLRAHTTQPP